MSIVALTWNSARFIAPFLDSLGADIDAWGQACEVFIVDNGSTDGTLERLRQCEQSRSDIHVISLPANRGTTVSRNLALRQARGEHILVIDTDTVIPLGTLQALVEATETLPAGARGGIVAPCLVYPNGDFQESARRFPTLFTKLWRLLHLEDLRRRDESIPAVLAQQRTPVDYAISAAWFFRRSLLDEVGYLDEAIFYAPEDVEFCARVWSHGYEVWYCPSVTLVHDCQRLTNRRPLTRLGLSHALGLFRYWLTYRSFLTRPARAT